ncbi:MAG: RHS repeat domain-containing protein, partial [Maribacter sp.]
TGQSIWINYQSKRSKLLSKQVFNDDNKLLTEEKNIYSVEPSVYNYRSDFKFYCDKNVTIGTYCGPSLDEYKLVNTSIRYRSNLGLNWLKKDSTELTNYFYDSAGTLKGALKTVTDYTYNNQNQEIQTFTTTSSDQTVIATNYKYAQDLNDTQLISENRISVPLETKVLEENNILSHSKTKYSDFNGTYLPSEIFSKKGALVDVNDSNDRKYTIDDYDNGKILEYHTENGISTSIVWGYNEQYPIAKIENATYSEISGLVSNLQDLSNEDNDNCTAPSCKEQLLRDALDAMRSNPSLADKMVTTYTYDPLIGVTSTTDPKGYTTYYEYDGLNRLARVRDAEGKIISENKYNYKNQ